VAVEVAVVAAVMDTIPRSRAVAMVLLRRT